MFEARELVSRPVTRRRAEPETRDDNYRGPVLIVEPLPTGYWGAGQDQIKGRAGDGAGSERV